jgi:hypothetical protein
MKPSWCGRASARSDRLMGTHESHQLGLASRETQKPRIFLDLVSNTNTHAARARMRTHEGPSLGRASAQDSSLPSFARAQNFLELRSRRRRQRNLRVHPVQHHRLLATVLAATTRRQTQKLRRVS